MKSRADLFKSANPTYRCRSVLRTAVLIITKADEGE